MTSISALSLARIQFAITISFHILFPSINIALGWILLYFRLLGKYHGITENVYKKILNIFALSFVMGVASGMGMSFQFGTNWPGFIEKVGVVATPLLAYEVLSAFFIEATALGLMLFSHKLIPKKIQTWANFIVCIGTTSSAFWIITLNSWMHTPSGIHIENNKIIIDSWTKIIFNPSMLHRFTHTILSSFLTAEFLIIGLCSYYLIFKKNKTIFNTLKLTLNMAIITCLLQFFSGDAHGRNTYYHHPETVAAIEALWETRKAAPLVLLAYIDEKNKVNKYSLEIPYGTSWMLEGDSQALVKGLNDFKEHPSVSIAFWSFRIMVGTGVLMFLISFYASSYILIYKNIKKWLLYILVLMTYSGWIATLSGWYLTETARQPYLVYGILKTSDAASKVLANNILSSLIAMTTLYIILIIIFIVTCLKIAKKEIPDDII